MDDRREAINQIREFNRFYTVLLGFLNRNYLNTGYSVTETRILFELKQNRKMMANDLTDILHLDKSYISRLIRNFKQKDIITREISKADRRNLIIELTPKGERVVDTLISITNQEILKLIQNLTPEACDDLCKSMKQIMNIFSNIHYSREEERHEQ